MKIKMGMFMTDVVGKVGGQCVQRNHYGLFARNITIPTNPQTTPQQDRRAQLEFLTANWAALTEGRREEWRAETANYPRTNRFGDTYYMTGQALYIGLNLNLWKIGEAFIGAPNTKVIPPDVGPFTVLAQFSTDIFEIQFDTAPDDPDTVFIVYATLGLSPGKKYISTLYRSIASEPADGSNPIDFYSEFIAYYGIEPDLDTKVFVKIVSVNNSCGCMGIPFYANALVT